MAKEPGFNGKIEVDLTNTGATWTELTNVVNCDFEPMRAMLEASDFGDEGEARIGGRTDFTASVPIYMDFANEATHSGLLDDILNNNETGIRIYPDRGSTFYFQAVCRVSTASGSISGGSTQQATMEFSNSDGNKWSYST